MVTLRKRTRTLETPENQEGFSSNEEETQKKKTMKAEKEKEEEVSRYEQCREMRIKENKERMQKLMDLSLKLQSEIFPKKPTSEKPSKRKPSSSASLPPRRSSRLEKAAPVNYADVGRWKFLSISVSLVEENIDSMVGEGEEPEIYSEEHDKLLGTCKSEWTFNVDGHESGNDLENGVRCHQCRGKSLGSHTHCSECKLVQTPFCGRCLYMRYGENVLEANQNQKWVCPRCRGICNCSVCRRAKGWLPTGHLYSKVTSLGFKSVAHFLIQTRRSKEETGTPSTN